MLCKPKIPPSFSVSQNGDTTLFIKERYKDIVLRMDSDAESFPERVKGNSEIKFGRGSYLSLPIAGDSTERFIIRNYRHGGLLGRLFGRVFCNANRPFHEIYLHEIAFQRGVPSSEVIAIKKRKLWGPFYCADFISKEISGSVDITHFLKESPPEYIQKVKKTVSNAVAKLIRNMHDAGIYHADLHLKNILVKKDRNGEFFAHIIDLDKSAIFDQLGAGKRIKNLLRLDRSIEKLRWLSRKAGACPKDLISRTDRMRFFRFYVSGCKALDKDWKRYARQYHTHHSLHRFWWHVLGFFQK